MKYVPPIGGGPSDPYVDANPAAGIEGSAVPAAAIEHPMREIMAVITAAGLTPSEDNLAQLAAAILQLIASGAASPGTAAPLMAGTAAVGTSLLYARQDHRHPTDTSRAPLNSPTFTGDPKAPTPALGDNDTSIATTAFVQAAIAGLAALASPTFTGDPKAPTPAPGDNDTSIATTAFVQAAITGLAALASPAFTGNPTAPTQALGTNNTRLATTAFVQAAIAAIYSAAANFSSMFVLSGVQTETLSANTNNLALAAETTRLRINATAPLTLTGVTGGAGNDGRQLTITNVGTDAVLIPHNNSGSTTSNRFFVDQAITLGPNQSMEFCYDGANSRWRPKSNYLTVAVPPVTKGYGSTWQTITSGGALTLAHGLGEHPKIVFVEAQCVTAEGPFAVGDRVALAQVFNVTGSTTNRGQSIQYDATNIYIRFGANSTVYEVMNPNTGGTVALTNANWRLVVRAFA